MLIPTHAGVVLAYYSARLSGAGDRWYMEAAAYILPWIFVPTILMLPTAFFRRSRLLVAFAFTPAALFIITYGHYFLPRSVSPERDQGFSILSYNVWAGNRQYRQIAASILEQRADIVALQEVTEEIAREIEPYLAERYPHRHLDNGLGLFSQLPISEYRTLRIGDDEEPAFIQKALIALPSGCFWMLNVHTHSPWLVGSQSSGLQLGIPNGFVTKWRDWEVQELLDVVDTLEGPIVVAGDFNLTDQHITYQDIHERFQDAHRVAGWGMGFTRTNYPALGLPMWRIDYVFFTPDLIAINTGFGEFGGSDHRPVIAYLAFE